MWARRENLHGAAKRCQVLQQRIAFGLNKLAEEEQMSFPVLNARRVLVALNPYRALSGLKDIESTFRQEKKPLWKLIVAQFEDLHLDSAVQSMFCIGVD